MHCPHTFLTKVLRLYTKAQLLNDSYNKETFITALPCPLHAVFMTHFVYKGHANQLAIRFATTSTAI